MIFMDIHTWFSDIDPFSASAGSFTRCSAAVLCRGTVRFLTEENSTALRYPLGTLSEGMLAAALMRLSEAGRLSVYDPVRRYLAGYPYDDHTVLDLLLHMTHCRPHFAAVPLRQDGTPDYPAMAAELKRSDTAAALPCAFDLPFLTAVMERAGGYPLAELLRMLVFAPLGMNGSTVRQEELPADAAVMPYDRETGTKADITPGFLSGGGIFSPVSDLARFVSALLDAKAGRSSVFSPWEADFLLRDMGQHRSPGFACASPVSGVFPDLVSPLCRGAVSGGCFLFLDPVYDSAVMFLSDGSALSGQYGTVRSLASYLWNAGKSDCKEIFLSKPLTKQK